MTDSPKPVARLRFYVPGGDEQPAEAEAQAWFAAHPQRRQRLQSQEGTVSVTVGAATAELSDLLTWIVPTLCFEAVAGVLDSGHAAFDLYNYSGGATLMAHGEQVELAGDLFPAVRAPRAELLGALLDLGERWLRLAAAIWPDDPDAASILPGLTETAAALRLRHAAAG